MPVPEKLMLMEKLWASLCEKTGDDMPVPAWHEEVLTERMRRIASGEEATSSWSEARERIRAQVLGR
ncbi:MAG: addiction module protein [Hylemonella sp.]